VGYSGSVSCRCVADHIAEAPAEFQLSVDPCGRVDEGFDWHDAELWARFRSWREHVCSHGLDEFGDLDHDLVSNAFGMAAFRQAVHEVGGLPVLARRLPTSNDGCIPAAAVDDALRELDVFRARAAGPPLHQMIDADTGLVIRELAMSEDGVFSIHGTHGMEMGFDGDGFFVRRDLAPRHPPVKIPEGPGIHVIPNADLPPPHEARLIEVFRARRVEQVLDGPPVEHDQPVRMIDRDTGDSIRSPYAVTTEDISPEGKASRRVPERFEVRTIPRPEDWFDYVLVPLRNLLEVASAHGTSLNWG
jgi:hypothetical protein